MTPSKFLVIRRDNIGDLVCTTPLISALRQHFPAARIDALVNSYNRPVVEHNPDLDHVYNYTKAKHRAENISVLRVYFDRIKLMWQLRRTNYEYVILANASCLPRPIRLARQVNPKRVIGFIEPDALGASHIDLPVTLDRANPAHECETLFKLLQPLGIKGTPPPMKVEAMPEEVARVKAQLDGLGWRAEEQIIGIHVSARQISQRWPADHFVALIKLLHQRYRAKFMLFWSPGDEQNPHHPGDDQKANAILQGAAGLPVFAYPTYRLDELVAGLAACSQVVCSDGGAMHLAAGLGKPIVCFFGNADRRIWYPWGVPHELIQPVSRDVCDIKPTEAFDAFNRLWQRDGHR